MGIEDFFLGALGGVAQAGAQGAAIEFKNEQELIRQSSLLDLENRYKSKQLKKRQEAVLNMAQTPEEAAFLRDASVALGPEDAGKLLLEQRERTEETAEERREKLIGVSDLTSILSTDKFDLGDTPISAVAASIHRGDSDLSDWRVSDDKDAPITDGTLGVLAEKSGLSVQTLRDLDASDKLTPTMIQSWVEKDEDTSTLVPIIDQQGNVRQVTKPEALQMTTMTDKDGKPLAELGRQEKFQDGFAIVSPNHIVPIGQEQEVRDISRRASTLERYRDAFTQSEQLQSMNLSHVDPAALTGEDKLGAVVGLFDAPQHTIGKVFGLGGKRQLRADAWITNLQQRTAAFFDAGGSRPLSNVWRNIENLAPRPNLLTRFFSDRSIITPIEELASNIQQAVDLAGQLEQSSASSEVRREAIAKIEQGEFLLSRIQTELANRKIENTTVPVVRESDNQRGLEYEMVGIADLSLNEIMRQSDQRFNFVDTRRLNPEEKALLNFWKAKLEIDSIGFD